MDDYCTIFLLSVVHQHSISFQANMYKDQLSAREGWRGKSHPDILKWDIAAITEMQYRL